MVLSVLFAFQIQPGGTRTAVQESGDRQNDQKGQTSAKAAGQTVAVGRGGERQVNILEADEDHTRDQIRG